MLSETDLKQLRRQWFWSATTGWFIYPIIISILRLSFYYRFENFRPLRRRFWEEIKNHDGPLIWAANHLTLIDSFLIFRVIFPWHRSFDTRLIPWSTPEYKNYYNLGGPIQKRVVRSLMYLCRAIPFLRGGMDDASQLWRDKVFAKLGWILRKKKGAVFVFPEAGRARNGWFDRTKPKDFLGRLALTAPNAKFLCVYFRGERQQYTTVIPEKADAFRVYFDLVPAVLPGEKAPREISQRLFDTIARLQDQWFAESKLPKNCAGNDVVDLKNPLYRERMDVETGEFDKDWVVRHLTAKELAYFESQAPEKRYETFWKFIAAKESCHKALIQSAIIAPLPPCFRDFEVDFFRRIVVHSPSGIQLGILFTDVDAEKVHCVAVLRGGNVGDEDAPGDVIWSVDTVPSGRSPSEFARERCLSLITEQSDDISSPDTLVFTDDDGVPKVLKGGRVMDWGVSLSHSGRFAACSFMIS